jgi:hypothetical protein
MSEIVSPTEVQSDALIARRSFAAPKRALGELSPNEQPNRRLRLFRLAWYAANVLLILTILMAAYSVVWEYSTREYLRGFSDAVVPDSSSTLDKVAAILQWMSRGPARLETSPAGPLPDRDPTETLNYASLLQVCGTATNAFINLADSAGLAARRLLLLDSRRITNHVVAEVLIGGRWVVVDPAFRTILHGSDGRLLTRGDLSDPAVFSDATQSIPGYSQSYRFDRATHVRLAHLGLVGLPLRHVLNRLLPGWDDSTLMSLLFERESLAAMVVTIVLVILLSILRAGLVWYGERLGVRPIRIRQQVRRAVQAFVDTTS